MIPVPVHRGAVYGSSHGNALLIAVMVTMFSLFCGFLPLSCAIPAVALAFLVSACTLNVCIIIATCDDQLSVLVLSLYTYFQATDASDVQTKRNLNFASRMCSALACGGIFLCVVAFTVWIGLSNTRNCRGDRGDRGDHYSCD